MTIVTARLAALATERTQEMTGLIFATIWLDCCSMMVTTPSATKLPMTSCRQKIYLNKDFVPMK